MSEFARSRSRDAPADEGGLEALHRTYIDEANRIGSVPFPRPLAAGKLRGGLPAVFIDQLGGRLAAERIGVRIYETLILKCAALAGMKFHFSAAAAARSAAATVIDLSVLKRIRDEEKAHFHLARRTIEALGADPTAMTPSGDVAGVMVAGLLQTVTDPRTSVAQSLNAVLAAELGDNAAWEILIELAGDLGHRQMGRNFAAALETERIHVEKVKAWLRRAVLAEAG